MRFEEERYVRVYSRDTTTWLMLPWQSRCILPLIARKLDRAGIVDLNDDGLDALAVMLAVPLEIVVAGMPELVRRDVLRIQGTILVWPKFMEGQEAKQSDKARQRASRERARDIAAAREQGVTIRDVSSHGVTEPSRNVTDCHITSHGVTPSLAVPSLAVEEEHSRGEAPEAPQPEAAKKRRAPKGTRLPEDWTPTTELVDRLRREHRVDPLQALRRFRNHWLNASRNAVKPRWDLAFENWVERDAADGKLAIVDAEDAPLIRAPGREKYMAANLFDGIK